MGTQVVYAINSQEDMEVVGGVDAASSSGNVELGGRTIAPAFSDLIAAIEVTKPDVLVDFTAPATVENNIRTALPYGVDCVIGTTGLTPQKYEELAQLAPEGTALFHAPNFTVGAVLMMEFSKKAAQYFADAEVIEFHHNGKKDAPSGTAIQTALGIAEARKAAGIKTLAPGKDTELAGREGARGADVNEVPVHAVRSNGYVAHQEVIFGSAGETLTIRHDSIDRAAYMPGVLLAIRKVGDVEGLVIGLEKFMDL
jgi:4-hydroxy-tetrahydrodipicolinate reductase